LEDHFEFVHNWPEWRRDNFTEFARLQALGARLWGSGKIENLKRQLELPSPEIPPGARKQDLLALEQHARMMLEDNHRWRPELDAVITVGSDQFTLAEAMYEIVLRALVAPSN
jgi:hypothetical protein